MREKTRYVPSLKEASQNQLRTHSKKLKDIQYLIYMTPIFSSIIDPSPDHIHDHLVFIAAKQLNILHDNAPFPGKKY